MLRYSKIKFKAHPVPVELEANKTKNSIPIEKNEEKFAKVGPMLPVCLTGRKPKLSEAQDTTGTCEREVWPRDQVTAREAC